MLKLIYLGQEYPCFKAEKGNQHITLYDENNSVIARFRGIRGFSGYSLIDGENNPASFLETEPDEITRIQLAIAELYEEVLSYG